MPAYAILLILLILLSPVGAVADQVFTKKLNDGRLVIHSPKSFRSKDERVFIDSSKKYKVKLSYGQLTIEANQASYNKSKNTLELKSGYRGSFEGYAIEGDYFRVNDSNGQFNGEGLKFSFVSAWLQAKKFAYNGEKIVVEQITSTPFDSRILSADTDRIEIYPEYSLVRRNTIKFFTVPIYYIPLYFNDQRRNYFASPSPGFEAKQDIYNGRSLAVHSNYFLTPQLFGDASYHLSEFDGNGFQLNQFVRISDHHQLNLNYLGWQKSLSEIKLGYVYNYFVDPIEEEAPSNFQQKYDLIQGISRIHAPGAFYLNYTQNEYNNRSKINRYPDILISGNNRGTLYDHSYTLTPYLLYSHIQETRIYPEDSDPIEVNREYEKRGFGLNASYYFETPYIRPYVSKALLSLNLEHSVYDPGSLLRDRLTTSVTIRRPLFSKLGLYYEFILTKLLVDHGQSPFFFEEYGLLKDNGALDLYLLTDRYIGGSQVIYDFSNGLPYNEIYYFGIKLIGDSYAIIRHDRRLQFWEFGFMKKELSF